MNIWKDNSEMPPIDTLLLVITEYKGLENNPEICTYGYSDWMYNKESVKKWLNLEKALKDLLSQSSRIEKLEKENEELKFALEICPGCGCHNCDCSCAEIKRQLELDSYEPEPTREMLMDGCIIDSNGNPY